jgi:hypothetical protein
MSATTLEPSRALLALHNSMIPALRKLRLEETNQAIIIYGVVSSYYQKQLAQEAIKPVLDGRKLLNRVIVDRSEEPART